MRDVLTVFSALSVPFTLEGGSLLHLFRNCNLGGSDLDFVIQLGWLNITNSQQLESALISKGLERSSFHGVREYLGYEESWKKDGVKVSSFLSGDVTKLMISLTTRRLTSSPAHSLWTKKGASWECGLMEN